MIRYLVDTNVLSELRKPKPHGAVLAFLRDQAEEDLYISDVSIAEIRFGAELREIIEERLVILNWLETIVRPLFAERCLHADEHVWLLWKQIEYEGRRRRHTYPQPDLVIAAIALRHGLTVVTRDITPFERAGAQCLDPWKA